MSDVSLKVDSTTRDLVWDSAGTSFEMVAGIELVTQRLIAGLRLFLGEWYLDESAGMAYYRDVLVNAPKTSIIEALFRRGILADPDIERIDSFAMAVDKRSRRITVSFVAVSTYGVVAASTVFP